MLCERFSLSLCLLSHDFFVPLSDPEGLLYSPSCRCALSEGRPSLSLDLLSVSSCSKGVFLPTVTMTHPREV